MDQKKKLSCSHAIFYPLFFIFSLKIFTTDHQAMAQQTVLNYPIRIGVVLDLNDSVGQMGLNCITMALSDFYTGHGHYRTRLIVHKRDSKGTAVGAAAAAVDLLKNVQVQAIIGPLFSVQANFLIELGYEAHVPIITFAASSPSLSSIRSPYFFRATVNDSSQVRAISAIVKAFEWREVVPVYVDNEFGEGIIPYLNDALEKVDARIPYRSVIPSKATDDQIVAELYKLMTMQTRVFVVHMLPTLASRLFLKAKQIGMMSQDYAWIITDAITDVIDSLDPSVLESMLGVIALKPYIPRTKELDNFTIRYKKRVQVGFSPNLNIFGLWAYDSATALAMAVEEAGITNARFQKPNTSRNSVDLESIGVSIAGPNLIQALSRSSFKGLAGNISLVNGQLDLPPYEILNVVGPSARVVGYWTRDKGIVKSPDSTDPQTNIYSTSKSELRSIIWPGGITYPPPKGWVVPTNGKKLRIGVPVKNGFTEFLQVTWDPNNATKVEGYCIDVFDAVIEAVPYGVPYEYIPFATPDHNAAGSYNDLVDQVHFGKYDAVVGDVTIVANRSQHVDFTLPYAESGVSMVVLTKDTKKKNPLVFLKPLTTEMWLTTLFSFVLIGVFVWTIEHERNTAFNKGTPLHQLGIILWFAFSTMVFAHKEKVKSNKTRLVLILWFLVVLIITQSYTASLTSMLTVQQLQPTITSADELIKNKDYIGYQKGSFVFNMLKKMNFDESRLKVYNSLEEMDDLFSKGSRNGGITAAFDEIPYIRLYLGRPQFCSKYTMVGPTYKTDGFAFVFPKGSPLVPDVSRAILNVTEGENMGKIERKWLGDNMQCPDSDTSISSNTLGLASFWVLFTIVGIAALVALVAHAIGCRMAATSNSTKTDIVEPIGDAPQQPNPNINNNLEGLVAVQGNTGQIHPEIQAQEEPPLDPPEAPSVPHGDQEIRTNEPRR